MSEPNRTQLDMAAFPGLVLDGDPNDIPLGAAREQTNATSETQGELRCRLGYLEVSFDA